MRKEKRKIKPIRFELSMITLRTPHALRILAAFVVFTLAGCGRPSYVLCTPKEHNIGLIRAAFIERSDWLDNGPGALKYEVRIENVTEETLLLTGIKINDTWFAAFREIGFDAWRKNPDPGRIPAKGAITITWSGDVPNHLVFKDVNGKSMPMTTRFDTFEIQHEQGIEIYTFPRFK